MDVDSEYSFDTVNPSSEKLDEVGKNAEPAIKKEENYPNLADDSLTTEIDMEGNFLNKTEPAAMEDSSTAHTEEAASLFQRNTFAANRNTDVKMDYKTSKLNCTTQNKQQDQVQEHPDVQHIPSNPRAVKSEETEIVPKSEPYPSSPSEMLENLYNENSTEKYKDSHFADMVGTDFDKSQMNKSNESIVKRKGLLNRLINSGSNSCIINDKVIKDGIEKKDVLTYPTDSDSEEEIPKVNSLWDNAELDSSDAESVDFEQNDPFRHTSIYTEEEIALSIRNKLVRLQMLYIREYRKLISNMKEKHRDYLTIMKKEKEIYGPLQKPKKLSAREKVKYYKLKTLSQYQKNGIGPETLLFKKMIECKKASTPHIYSRSRIFNKCIYTEGGMRCCVKVVPGSKYCMKHILRDPYQVMFKACAVKRGDSTCEEPVDIIFDNATCVLHKPVPSSSTQIDTK